MFMYRSVGFSRWKIEKIEVVKVTDKQVVTNKAYGDGVIREAKNGGWANWHETWEEAHAFLAEEAGREIQEIESKLAAMKAAFEINKQLKNPEQ